MKLKAVPKKAKCIECEDEATGYIGTKPYCTYHYERIWYKTRTKRKHQDQLNKIKVRNA